MTDPTPDPTPTRDEALLRALIEELRPYAAKPLGSIRIDTDDIRKIVDWFDASAPAPASGGVDAVVVRALRAAKMLIDNINEFGQATDPEILDCADTAVRNALGLNEERPPEFSISDSIASLALSAIKSARQDANRTLAVRNAIPEIMDAAEAAGFLRSNWAEASIVALASLSPAATPVSEAEGERYATPIREEDILEVAMEQFWKADGGNQEGVKVVLEWAKPVFFDMALAKPASPPAGGDVREALEKARVDVVCAIAFLSRDLGTERERDTVRGVIDSLVKTDNSIRAALSGSDVEGRGHV